MKILGVIGDPIDHSLSPVMHNAAIKKAKLKARYIAFHVKPPALKGFIKKMKSGAWDEELGGELLGFNVTIPHKEKIVRYLDHLSDEAKIIGAVNTVIKQGNRLVGANTDAVGYLRSLREETRFQPRGKQVVVLGAGGAARAVIYILSKSGADTILIANRTLRRGHQLAREFQKLFPKTHFQAIPLSADALEENFPGTGLLINTTSIGLHGSHWEDLPLKALPKKAIVSDLVYRPLLTELLKDSKKQGLKVHSGIGMLLHQGAESFRIWLRQKPDTDIMRKALLDALK